MALANKTNHEFKVSKQNLQRLSRDFDVNLDELDNKTRESLLGMYDPGKSTLAHKTCDYAGWFFLVVSLIAVIRSHWISSTISLFIGLTFLFTGFLIQRNHANKNLRIYRKKIIHSKTAGEALFINDVWQNIIEQLRKKRPLFANMLIAGKIKPRTVSGNVVFLTGNKEFYKHLRNPHEINSLSEIIKDTTGEAFKIYFL